MDKFITEHKYFFIAFFSLLTAILVLEFYERRYNTDSALCKNAVVKEEIKLSQEVTEGVTEEVTQYLVQCIDNTNSHTFRIQTDRNYPLNSHIKKTWVQNGK